MKSHTSSERVVKDGKVLWGNIEGDKKSHEINVTQMNVKDTKTGDHIYYNTKSGKMGAALGGAERKHK